MMIIVDSSTGAEAAKVSLQLCSAEPSGEFLYQRAEERSGASRNNTVSPAAAEESTHFRFPRTFEMNSAPVNSSLPPRKFPCYAGERAYVA